LGLIVAFEPAQTLTTARHDTEQDFALLDDVDVFSGSREQHGLQVTEAPTLLSPTANPFAEGAQGEVVQAAYTTGDEIDVIRPVEYQSSLSRGPQGAWLTGDIEESAAPLKRSAEISSRPTR
jgi:hypothetical protein